MAMCRALSAPALENLFSTLHKTDKVKHGWSYNILCDDDHSRVARSFNEFVGLLSSFYLSSLPLIKLSLTRSVNIVLVCTRRLNKIIASNCWISNGLLDFFPFCLHIEMSVCIRLGICKFLIRYCFRRYFSLVKLNFIRVAAGIWYIPSLMEKHCQWKFWTIANRNLYNYQICRPSPSNSTVAGIESILEQMNFSAT